MLFPNLLLSQWPGCCLDNMSYIGINAAIGSRIFVIAVNDSFCDGGAVKTTGHVF